MFVNLILTFGCLFYVATPQLLYTEPKKPVAKSLMKSLYKDDRDSLKLTSYIEEGDIEIARELSRVNKPPFNDSVVSYSGYFTVDKTFNSNLFFWFFPAEQNYEDAPVVLWLQGGPGSSSMFGLFTEIGPYIVNEDDATVEKMPIYWSGPYSVLFIDSPVGTGFSYTQHDSGYSSNQSHVASNLYKALTQFYLLFPELQTKDLYLSGESYAGKYIPALAYKIHTANPHADLKIRLQGLFIGNGATDPISMLHYSDYAYQLGLVDKRSRKVMHDLEDQAREDIENGRLDSARAHRSMVFGTFRQASNFRNMYNFLYDVEPKVGGNLEIFLNSDAVREALHVGDQGFIEINYDVYYFMSPDLMVSVRPWVEELLEDGYHIVFYNGQLDIIVAYPLSVSFFKTLKFSSAKDYKSANRKPWYVDGELAGYIKTAGNFSEVLVRNAGHMVPTDQPKWAFDLLNRFIYRKGL